MSFTYNNSVPAAANNPSNDQPDMLTNAQSVEGIINVDHITFNTLGGGQHKQITFNNKNVPAAQTDPQSVCYTNSGTASSVSQMFYRNQNGTFQVSPIKAWGLVDSAGNILGSQSLNIATVTPAGTGRYNIALSANAVNSTNFAVLVTGTVISSANGVQSGYNITGVGTFQLVFLKLDGSGFEAPINFSFLVMQI
jgi:hypothetical protein